MKYINKLSAYSRNKVNYKTLFVFVCIVFVLYQIDNSPRVDDDYLGEQVYCLLNDGVVRSNFGYEDLGYHTYQSIYHKLFVYCGYLFSSIFGWSLTTLHSVSFCWFLLFVVILTAYQKRYQRNYWLPYTLGTLAIMMCNADFLIAAANFRPEVMLMTLGFSSFFALQHYLHTHKRYALLLSGVLSGLCVFCHLNGVIFVVAAVVLLFRHRRPVLHILLFLCSSLIAFLPYFADVIYHASLPYFYQQFFADPILSNQSDKWYSVVFNLLNEQMRFFYTVKQISFTACLLIALVFAFKKLKGVQSDLLLYTLILVLGLAIISTSKTPKYLVIYMPFLVLILVNALQVIVLDGKKIKQQYIISTLLAAYFIIGLGNALFGIWEHVGNLVSGGIVKEHAQLSSQMEDKALSKIRLLAPRPLIFNEIKTLKVISDIEMVSKEHIVNAAQDYDYLVFSERDAVYFDYKNLITSHSNLFKPIYQTKHYYLVKVLVPQK